jgi:hypothetical protein
MAARQPSSRAGIDVSLRSLAAPKECPFGPPSFLFTDATGRFNPESEIVGARLVSRRLSFPFEAAGIGQILWTCDRAGFLFVSRGNLLFADLDHW